MAPSPAGVRIEPRLLVAAGATDAATAERVAPGLQAALERFGLATPLQAAGFLSQCAHESNGFRSTVERLGYSADRLRAVFKGQHFTPAEAAELAAAGPVAIANRVYAGRLGNGDEASGDGWRFRGRGYIQLTGRASYAEFAAAEWPAALTNPDSLALPVVAAMSAAWFWAARGCMVPAAAGDVEGMTRAVNGPALLGLEERRALYTRIRKEIAP